MRILSPAFIAHFPHRIFNIHHSFLHSHSASDMAQSGKDVEKIVLARALKARVEDRVFVSGNKTIIFD
jgi:formyltetrahydrofolate deformylase